MKNLSVFFILVFIFCFSSFNLFAQKIKAYTPVTIEKSAELQKIVDKAVEETVKKFADKDFKAENIAVTLIDLRNPDQLKSGEFRGEEKMYPASVVKMFFDVALRQWIANGKLKLTPATERAEKDMIVDSSNEATQYIVDLLTGTSNGEELPPSELKKYGEKRDIVNRYFASLGYKNININQKTYGESLFGRERQWWDGGKNRNMLTTNATARLMTEIALGKAVNAEQSAKMMELMKRDWETESKDTDNQATGFTGIALKELNLKGAKLWSKAGWISTARHDVAYIETPNGLKFVLCVFTNKLANEKAVVPNVTKVILETLWKNGN